MPVYSHTQLATFEQCPLRYRFQYLDKIPKPEAVSAEAFTGARVHETLQKLYEDLKYGKMNGLDELLAYYREQWRRNRGAGIRIVREGLAEDHFQDYGQRCIGNYYSRHYPFDDSVTLKTEFHLLFALDGEGRYKLQGYIDRLARRRDGVYEIHDYKTSANLASQSHVDADRQLALYHIGLKSCWNDVEQVELIWHYVGFDTTLVSRRSAEQLEELSRHTASLIDQIEHCTDFAPVKSALCEWCEYRTGCPLWKHVIAIRELPPAAINADEGFKLATEYAGVKAEMEVLTMRLSQIRNRILEYARRQEVSTLQGNGFQVSVKERPQMLFPSRDEEEWRRLEEYIRGVGRWEEVSDLSVKKLQEVVAEERWTPESLEMLKTFVRFRPVSTIRVSQTDLPAAEESADGADPEEAGPEERMV